jgi:hypothetical protein
MSKARDLANAGTALTTVSATELGYLDGVTSAVQTQINSKEATLPSQTGNTGKYLTTDGSSKSWGTVSQYALPSQTGNSGKYLTTNGTAESWGTVTVPPVFTPRSGLFNGVVRQINGIASNGSNIYVAVAEGGYLKSSTDSGVTWTERTANLGAVNINAVAFGNGIFVAVSNTNGITTSTDGITWTARTSNVSGNLYNVRYLNGNFIAVGTGANAGAGGITTSTDGITWTKRNTPGTGNSTDLRDVTYGNGYYVAVGMWNTASNAYYSTNLTTWTALNLSSSNNFLGAYYINNQFVYFFNGNIFIGTNTPAAVTTNASYAVSLPSPSGGTTTAIYNNIIHGLMSISSGYSAPVITRVATDINTSRLNTYYQHYILAAFSTSNGSLAGQPTALYVSPTDGKIVYGDIDGRIFTSF